MALLLASLAAGAYVDSVARELHALEAELLSLERDVTCECAVWSVLQAKNRGVRCGCEV